MNVVPYVSQYASQSNAHRYATGQLDPVTDPEWRRSGWATSSDYAFWAGRSCGAACLQMLLAQRGELPTTAELVTGLMTAGAYRLNNAGSVDGLIYRPFVEYAAHRWDLTARSWPKLPVRQLIKQGAKPTTLIIASVRPQTRDLDPRMPTPAPADRRGGHLVLVLASTDVSIKFHNPSGVYRQSQINVELPIPTFDSVYAQRCITVDVGPT